MLGGKPPIDGNKLVKRFCDLWEAFITMFSLLRFAAVFQKIKNHIPIFLQTVEHMQDIKVNNKKQLWSCPQQHKLGYLHTLPDTLCHPLLSPSSAPCSCGCSWKEQPNIILLLQVVEGVGWAYMAGEEDSFKFHIFLNTWKFPAASCQYDTGSPDHVKRAWLWFQGSMQHHSQFVIPISGIMIGYMFPICFSSSHGLMSTQSICCSTESYKKKWHCSALGPSDGDTGCLSVG